MTMKETREERKRRVQAIKVLLDILAPGQAVYCIKYRPPARKGRTGAPCHWRILAVESVYDDPEVLESPKIVDITSKVARAIGARLLKNGLLWTTDYSGEIVSALSIALGYPPASLKERTL